MTPLQRASESSVSALATAVILLTVVAAGMALPSRDARAHSYKLGDISVGHTFAPPPVQSAGGLPVYGPILNRGDRKVRLVGASSPIAERVRLRRMNNGKATWPNAVDLKPGKPHSLAAWSEHIWVSGLKKPLKDGDSFELTLDFGKAGQMKVKVIIEKASGH